MKQGKKTQCCPCGHPLIKQPKLNPPRQTVKYNKSALDGCLSKQVLQTCVRVAIGDPRRQGVCLMRQWEPQDGIYTKPYVVY